MMNTALSLIELRASATSFDPSHEMPDAQIEALTGFATRAPTAYNLQNWRFVAVRTRAAKARLRALAFDQAKVEDAAVTFIVSGILPDADTLIDRLRPAVQVAGMPLRVVETWRDMAAAQYARPGPARDEAFRSATLGAATLIHAAQAMGLASCPMGGFDADGVKRAFGLGGTDIPVLLVAVGRGAAGNRPQKPRRPLSEVLDFA